MANKKKRKQLKIEALSNNIITKSEAKKLKKAGVSNSQIKKLKEQAKDKRQELRPIRQAVPEGELRDAVTEVIADGKLGKKDLKKLVDKGLSIEQVKDVASQASNTSSLKVGKKIRDPGQVEKLAINQEIKNNPNATLTATGDQDNQTSFGGGSEKPLVPKQEEEDLGFDRVGFYADKDDPRIGYEVDPDTGIAYTTFTKGGLDNRHFLQIGNIPNTRVPGGSPQMHVKIVDYDASIENYSPDKLGFVKEVEKGKKGKIKKVTFKDIEVKRQKYNADTFRTESRKQEYANRGLTSEGGRVNETNYKGDRQEVKTRSNGTLQRLTLTDNGDFVETNDQYPKAVKANTFSDQLATAGLSIGRGGSTRFDKSKRDSYIQQGKSQFST